MRLAELPIAAALLWTLAASVPASPVYRWTDAQGRTHYGDAVPSRYQSRATPVVALPRAVPDDQITAARERVDRLKTRLDAAQQQRQEKERPVAAGGPASRRAAAEPSTSAANCRQLWQAYDESLECFAPFVNANGTMKPGAHERCVELPDPSWTCGTRVRRP